MPSLRKTQNLSKVSRSQKPFNPKASHQPLPLVFCSFCKSSAEQYQPGAHTFERCPRLTCARCFQKGHSSTNCSTPSSEINCRYCKTTGHTIDSCFKVRCSECKQTGHPAWLCEAAACGNCTLHHPTDRCWFGNSTVCTRCNSGDHEGSECSQCRVCYQWGHENYECPKATCSYCKTNRPKDANHHIIKCTHATCRVCGEKGHSDPVCPIKEYMVYNKRSNKKKTISQKEEKGLDLESMTDFPTL